jgi:hypothetical protein
MARRTVLYTVTDEGRDKGKAFFLTEMAAAQAEAWATKLLFAMMATNVELPEGFQYLGVAGLAEVGMKAIGKIPYEIAEPMLNEMMEGIQIIPNPSKPNVKRPLIVDGINPDIEEPMTSIKLKIEVWKLNMDFLRAAASLFFPEKEASALNTPQPTI